MSEMQGTLFEFDQNNELHRKAQHYIETMDREKFPAFGDLMVTAIVDYFDRYHEQNEPGNDDHLDPAAPQGAEADLEARIEAAVEHALERKLPEVLAPYLEDLASEAGSDGKDQKPPEEEAEAIDLEAVKKDIDWGFLGG